MTRKVLAVWVWLVAAAVALGSSASALGETHAPPPDGVRPLGVTGASGDTGAGLLTIRGRQLLPPAEAQPVLIVVRLGEQELEVLSASDDEIQAALPLDLTPGRYPLQVWAGPGAGGSWASAVTVSAEASPEAAEPQALRIREGRADLERKTLLLRGEGFVSPASPRPAVTLADLPLRVLAATEDEIQARLPVGLAVGSYRVRVLRGPEPASSEAQERARTILFADALDVAVAPAAPLGAGDITAVWTPGGGGLQGGADTGDVTLALLSCVAGQVLKSSGGSWACAADVDTGVNAVTSGGGITGAIAARRLTLGSTSTPASVAGAIVARDGASSFSAGSIGLTGSLSLPKTTSATVGVINKMGGVFLHDFGTDNTFVGPLAGNFTLTGARNTAVGSKTLGSLSSGSDDAAVGDSALMANTTGSENSAFGSDALMSNTTGNGNSAFGYQALASNTTNTYNSAFGYQALQSYARVLDGRNSAFGAGALRAGVDIVENVAFGFEALANTTHGVNSAFGLQALVSNTTGSDNSAFGYQALYVNTTGSNNAAFGTYALGSNTDGGENTAVGDSALLSSTTGRSNTAVGYGALQLLHSGSLNTALGHLAGSNLEEGMNNIYIGHPGHATESNTIRIGERQTATYVQGIWGRTAADGIGVFARIDGKLGTLTSSQRYKEEILDMAAESDVLMKLRPVSFYYRPELDATHTRQYGLVAEDVAEVAPELVVRDETGAPQTVRYHFVNAMLLNEVQRQQRRLDARDQQLDARKQQLGIQDAEIRELKELLARLAARVAR